MMQERVKRLIIRWPKLYSIAAGISRNLRFSLIAERVIGTKAREREWSDRHRRKGSDWGEGGENRDWVAGYWDSRDHPHRIFLTEKIADFAPVTSVLEIGCNCGPNLYHLARRFPSADIHGTDINAEAISKGRELIAAEGIENVTLAVGRADELEKFADKAFDVVFTDAVLIYIGRDKITQTMKEMIRIARKGLVLLERYKEKGKSDGRGTRRNGLWYRDYPAMIRQYIPEAELKISRITADTWDNPDWIESGAVIEVIFPVQQEKPE